MVNQSVGNLGGSKRNTHIMNSKQQLNWVKITEHESTHFREGALIRFKTRDTLGNHYKFALAVRMDNAEDLAFFAFDGTTWGCGRSTLQEEARFQGKPCTVSRHWLISNFLAIAEPENINDIWVLDESYSKHMYCSPTMQHS